MPKIIRMTEEEIFKNYDVKEAIDMAKSAPEEKEIPFNQGQVVTEFKKHLKKKVNIKEKTALGKQVVN